MPLLYCDLETYSDVPIKSGTHAYAEGVEVMLFAYALDDEPVKVWDLTASPEMPADLCGPLLYDNSVTTVWHNGANFDRVMLKHGLRIDLPVRRIHDTMVQALAHGLPGSLGTLCEIFNIPTDKAKDKRGSRLIQMFCKPQSEKSKVSRYTCETHPKEWAEFIEYAGKDIEAMRALYKVLPRRNYPNNPFEQKLFELDQKINDRGIAIDMALVHGAIEATEKAKKELAKKGCEMTFGDVNSTTQRDALLKHILGGYGIALPDLTSATLERRIADPDLPPMLRELLAVRLEATTASVAKYRALLRGVSKDGRLRGTLQFCGASRTGRWAGRVFQPQNLPRPSLEQDDIDAGIQAFKTGCADLITDNVMTLASNCIRGCLTAAPGKTLVVSDLSNIEGRVAAWLAGESWKLQAFREYDAGTGPDLYKLAYAKSFNIKPEEVTKPQRQIGKVMELMLQYGGGVGAFITGANGYGIDLEDLAVIAWPNIPERVRQESLQFWDYCVKNKQTLGLSKEAFTTCDALKRLWREAHPAISSMWKELEERMDDAIRMPGVKFKCRSIEFERVRNWLFVKLPSGRYLCYASPSSEGKLSHLGLNQYSRKWERTPTYGGKILENITQAAARDVMGNNMVEHVEPAGFEILLTVHDELITEHELGEGLADELSALLSQEPAWAPGLPLSAGGFQTLRYRKD